MTVRVRGGNGFLEQVRQKLAHARGCHWYRGDLAVAAGMLVIAYGVHQMRIGFGAVAETNQEDEDELVRR